MSKLVDKGLRAKRESRFVDFKRSFDPESAGEWCEIIKDVVAMANSGGGVILIGIENNGAPSGEDVSSVLAIDDAQFVDKIRRYTHVEFSSIEVHEAEKNGQRVVALEVSEAEIPLIFQHVGTYEVSPKKQKTAFSQGSIYFRHGAKSEPGNRDDLRRVIDRHLETIRKEWMEGVRKVVRAPQGATVSVFKGDVRESKRPDATPIRLVDDPESPGYRLIDHDTTYPYRQKELIDVVNGMLPDGVDVNSYDVLAIRRVYDIDDDYRYCHEPKFASPQYTDAFAIWMTERHKADNEFFNKARQKYYEQVHKAS